MSLDGYQSIRNYKGGFDKLTTKDLTVSRGLTSDGDVVIDVTSESALDVRRNNDGDSVLLVDTVDSTVNINGDVNVTGAITYADQLAFTTSDNLLIDGSGNLTDSVDLGLLFNYNSTKYAGLYRDETAKEWRLIKDLVGLPTTHVGVHSLDSLSLDNLTCTSIILNKLGIDSSSTQKLSLDFAADHCYIEFATNNFSGRSASIGYPASASNNFTIQNERTTGDIRLIAPGSVLLNGNDVVSLISSNASDIADNASDIVDNAAAIADNASAIADNTAAIADNTIDIANNTADISDIISWEHKATEDFDMGGYEILNCSNINQGGILTMGNAGDTTPYFRMLNSGGYAVLQGGSSSGNNSMWFSGLSGARLDGLLMSVDGYKTTKYSDAVVTYHRHEVAKNQLRLLSTSNDSNAYACAISLETHGGIVKLETGFDNNPPGNSNNFTRLTNSTANVLEMPEIEMQGDIDMDDNAVIGINKVGVGIDNSASLLHIRADDLGVYAVSDLNNGDGLTIEANDAGLELISDNGGSWGSYITLKERSGGETKNFWGTARQTGLWGSHYCA